MFHFEFYDEKGQLDHNAMVGDLRDLAIVAQGRTMKITREATKEEAFELVNKWGEQNGHSSLLDTLTAMKGTVLERKYQWAFDKVFADMRRLFHGDD